VLYGRDADRTVTIYKGTLPTAAQEDQFKRAEQMQQVEAAISGAVAEAFEEPAHQPAEMRESISLLSGAGSDIARSLRGAIEAVSGDDGDATAVVDLTDGLNDTAELPLAKLLAREAPDQIARRLARVAGMGSDTKVGLIAIPTVGQVPAQYQADQSPELTDRLVEAWHKTCQLLQAAKCEVTTSA
jgi:hypothetical protein